MHGLHRRTPSLVRPPSGRFDLGLYGDPACHSVKPTGQGIGLPHRAGFTGQHQERGLEGVVGVLRVAEDLPADAEDHRPVALHQRREGRLVGSVPQRQEPLNELPVREVADHTEPQEGGELVRKVMTYRSARHRHGLLFWGSDL